MKNNTHVIGLTTKCTSLHSWLENEKIRTSYSFAIETYSESWQDEDGLGEGGCGSLEGQITITLNSRPWMFEVGKKYDINNIHTAESTPCHT